MADVRTFHDAEALADAVALALIERLDGLQAAGEVPQIGLTGGTIADQVHAHLGQRGPFSGIDFDQVVFWWGDERFVAPDSPDRNARAARELFLDRVGVSGRAVHEVPSTADVATCAEAAAAYSATMREHGAGEFDVLMLGMGPDGHVASLFPHHPALAVEDRIAVAVDDSPKPPPERVSLTLAALNRSAEVWFVVAGAEKADAVARALAAEGDVAETPARGVHGRVATVWWLDEAAASGL